MKIALLVAMCSVGLLFIAHQVRLMLREARGGKASALPEADLAGIGAGEPEARVGGGGPLVLGGTGWGGLLVEAGPDELLLVLLPLVEPLAPNALREAGPLGEKVRRMIVINDPAVGGSLDATAVREALGLSLEQVHATAADHPIDRVRGVGRVRKASALPAHLEQGELDVERLADNAILVRHEPKGQELLVGVALTEAQLAARPITRVIGSLAEPAAAKAILAPNLARVALAGEQGFLLFAGAPPDNVDALVQVLQTIGVGATVIQQPQPWVELATRAAALVRAQDTAALAALLDEHPPDWVARAMIGLIAGDDEDTARQLGEAALARGPNAEVHHQLAILASIHGDDATAERHLRVAMTDHAPSLINLAMTLAMRDDEAARAEAIELADRAAAAMPDDGLARRAPFLVRAYGGQIDAARALLPALALDTRERVLAENLLDGLARGDRPRRAATFPSHADLAAKHGAQLMDQERWADAIRVLERARVLDPLRVEIVADLGVALSNAGREPDALALYDRAIDELPEGNLLRLNRGNARRRTGDVAGAIDDYQFLVERAPALVQPRAALAATLAAAGRTAAAEAEVKALETQGAPAALLEALRAEIERAMAART